MREIRLSGSEGGGFEFNRLSLPLSKLSSATLLGDPSKLFLKLGHHPPPGSGVICCGTAILAVTLHGRDARRTSK